MNQYKPVIREVSSRGKGEGKENEVIHRNDVYDQDNLNNPLVFFTLTQAVHAG